MHSPTTQPLPQPTLTNLLTHPTLYHTILTQLEQQQKEVYVMCQSNKDYQGYKDKFKNKMIHRSLVTYFAVVSMIRTMLTGRRHELVNRSDIYVDTLQQPRTPQQKLKSSLNPTPLTPLQPHPTTPPPPNPMLNPSTTPNPYSHLLCLRLLKDSLLLVDYSLLTLIESQLSHLLLNISLYDPTNKDQQRGRSLYLQGVSSQQKENDLAMSYQQLEVVGYSVHMIVLEVMEVLGTGVKVLPYHEMGVSQGKKELKVEGSGYMSPSSTMTDRMMLTPRTANSTFPSQFHRLAMTSLNTQLHHYPSTLLPSRSSLHYSHTKQVNIAYPQRMHYFKHKEIQRFKKEVVFNSEQKQYHVVRFYQFLLGVGVRGQGEVNRGVVRWVVGGQGGQRKEKEKQENKLKGEGQSGKNEENDKNGKKDVDRDDVKERYSLVQLNRSNGFLLVLKNILQTRDRFCLYYTIVHLANALKLTCTYPNNNLTSNQKSFKSPNKQPPPQNPNPPSSPSPITSFLSICQIISSLTMTLTHNNNNDNKKEKDNQLNLEYFSLEMFLAVDRVLGELLVETWVGVGVGMGGTVEGKEGKGRCCWEGQQQWFANYAGRYLCHLLTRFAMIRQVLIDHCQKQQKTKYSINKELLHHLSSNQSQSILSTLSHHLQTFHKNHPTFHSHNTKPTSSTKQQSQYSFINSPSSYIDRLESIKGHFAINLEQIHPSRVQIPKQVIQSINQQLQLLQCYNLVEYAKTKSPTPSIRTVTHYNDDTSINHSPHQQQQQQESPHQPKTPLQQFIQSLQTPNTTNNQHFTKRTSTLINISVLDLDGMENGKKVTTVKRIKEECEREREREKVKEGLYDGYEQQEESEMDIPRESFTRPKSIDSYRLMVNPNDISRLNFGHSTNRPNSQQSKPIVEESPRPTSKRQPLPIFSPQPFTIPPLSFKQSLLTGSTRMNLVNRDTQTLRNLSRRKCKRKPSNSRVNMIPQSSSTIDQALSCPTYMDEHSITSSEFGESFEQLPSEQNLFRKSKEMERMFVLEREEVRREDGVGERERQGEGQGERGMRKNKEKKEGEGMVRGENDSITEAGGYNHHHQEESIRIKDSISKQVHRINLNPNPYHPSQQPHQHHPTCYTPQSQSLLQQPQHSNLTQKHNQLDIKDTQSYQLNVHVIPTPYNRTKNKSRFNPIPNEEDSIVISRPRFDSSDRKQPTGKQATMNKKNGLMTPAERSHILREWSGTGTDSEISCLQNFHFPPKVKKDLMKKKVLLVKDQRVEVGMITQFQKVPGEVGKSVGGLNKQEEKLTQKYTQFKLKSSLYITPLVKINKIELEIRSPPWLMFDFTTNKVKKSLKPDSQYISYVDFWLGDVANAQKSMNVLPELEILVDIDDSVESKGQGVNKSSPTTQKFYKLPLPIFLNKFFTEQPVTQDQLSQLTPKLSSPTNDQQWIEISPKLIKQPTDLQKYFSRLKPLSLKQGQLNNQKVNMSKLVMTKFSFLNEAVYVCFGQHQLREGGKEKLNVNKEKGYCCSFKVFLGSQVVSQRNGKNAGGGVGHSKVVENLVLTTVFSLLIE